MEIKFQTTFVPRDAREIIQNGLIIIEDRPEIRVDLNNITLYQPTDKFLNPGWNAAQIIQYGYDIAALGSLGFAGHIIKFPNDYSKFFFSNNGLELDDKKGFYIPILRTLLRNPAGKSRYCFVKYSGKANSNQSEPGFELVFVEGESFLDLPIKYLSMK